MDIMTTVLNDTLMRQAYDNACSFRKLDPETFSIGGKPVGKHKFTCTQRLIASIVYETYTV